MTIDSQRGLASIWPPPHRYRRRGRATLRDHPAFLTPIVSVGQPKGRRAERKKHRVTDGDNPFEGNAP
jgi:hypothetical protein